MPYYVYRIDNSFGIRKLEFIQQFDVFKEASTFAKAERKQLTGHDQQVKVIYAENPLQAEDLLNQVREPEPFIGDDY